MIWVSVSVGWRDQSGLRSDGVIVWAPTVNAGERRGVQALRRDHPDVEFIAVDAYECTVDGRPVSDGAK